MRPDSDRGQKRYELAFLSLASHATPPQQGGTVFFFSCYSFWVEPRYLGICIHGTLVDCRMPTWLLPLQQLKHSNCNVEIFIGWWKYYLCLASPVVVKITKWKIFQLLSLWKLKTLQKHPTNTVWVFYNHPPTHTISNPRRQVEKGWPRKKKKKEKSSEQVRKRLGEREKHTKRGREKERDERPIMHKQKELF